MSVVEVTLVALYNEKGKSGNDFLYKELTKVPIKPNEFKNLRKFEKFFVLAD